MQKAETKEWNNIDFTNTVAYRTVKAWREVGVTWEKGEAPAGVMGGILSDEFTHLKRLRKLDQIIKPEKGSVVKEITHITRIVTRQRNKEGRIIQGEFLTTQGEFKGVDFANMEVGYEFQEGWAKVPVIRKVYSDNARFDKDSGEDLGKEQATGSTVQYFIEVPKDGAKRKKLIEDIIGNNFPENIIYIYKEGDTPGGSRRDDSFSHKQFIECSAEQLRDLSKRSAGDKGIGYWRDQAGRLHDKDGNIIG